MFVQNALCKKGLFAGQTIMISNDVYRQSRRMLLTAKYAGVREVYCQLRSIPLAGKHPNLLRIMPPVKCWRQFLKRKIEGWIYLSLVIKMFYLCIRITQFYDILSFSIFISILYETLYETICAVFRQIKRLFRIGVTVPFLCV